MSKLFTIFFIVSGVGVFLYAIKLIAQHYFTERMGVMERTMRRVQIQATRAMERWTPEKEKKEQSRRSFVKEMSIINGKEANQEKKR